MNKRLPLSVGTILQSRYTIVGQLGHGGMGAVYEAKDNRTSATVALKETYADDDYMRNAFEREAKMLANMTHEAFPRVMDYFAEDDGFYLVMELIRGKDLSELLEERNAPFDTEQVLEWADQILDALEDLHSQDIVHRDIKPSNLKLTPRGRIKLLDFGIAKGAAGDMTALQSTVGSMAAATLQYAPLEQVLRADTNWFQMLCVNFSDRTLEILDHGTDARSDLYALGATLYHLLTNTLPINAPTRALSIWSGLADKLRPAREINQKVSPELSVVLQKALEIDREKRFSSASEMRKMLSGGKNDKYEETIVVANEKTLPLAIQPAFPTPKSNAVETEILNHDSTFGFHNTVDKPEVETVVRVFPSNVNSKRRKINAWAIIGIFAVALILLVFLFLIFGPTGPAANKSISTGNTSNADSPSSISKNSIGVELMSIPPGEFMMGSTDSDVDETLFESKKYSKELANRNLYLAEMPKHKVNINNGFWIGKYEITQGQWQAVMGANPSKFTDCGANCPVEQVSWDDVQVFLKRLNAKNDGFEYSLPSEAQWEYTARAGTTTAFAFGDSLNSSQANFDGEYPYASTKGKNIRKTVTAGSYQPNAWGVYDMHGNVFELVQDIYNSSYQNLPADGSANLSVGNPSFRVMRGGSWPFPAETTRSASRSYTPSPSNRQAYIGFRVAARPK